MSSINNSPTYKFPLARRVYATTIPSELVGSLHETPSERAERLNVIKRKERTQKLKNIFGGRLS